MPRIWEARLDVRRFTADISGQFAVWFAIVAFPLLAATSLVLDIRSAEAK